VDKPLPVELAHVFRDPRLLEQALTHRSADNRNNERLEFLGDAMLGLVVAEELYRRFPDADEGQLTRLRAALVRKETLASIAASLRLGDFLRLGEGELKSGGFRRESILANALEALLGAIHLDGGFAACRERIVKLYEDRFSGLDPDLLTKDPKTELQEWLQARRRPLPVYRLLKTEGEPHDRRFTVECIIEELPVPLQGEGRSRRAAEQEAAGRALDSLSAH
jgi:ribonuclease-3